MGLNFADISPIVFDISWFFLFPRSWPAAILDFRNREILLADEVQMGEIHVHHCIEFWSKSVILLQRYCVLNGGRPPSWKMHLSRCGVRPLAFVWGIFGSPVKSNGGFCYVPNLLTIGTVVSIIWKLKYLARLAGKWLFKNSRPPN